MTSMQSAVHPGWTLGGSRQTRASCSCRQPAAGRYCISGSSRLIPPQGMGVRESLQSSFDSMLLQVRLHLQAVLTDSRLLGQTGGSLSWVWHYCRIVTEA